MRHRLAGLGRPGGLRGRRLALLHRHAAAADQAEDRQRVDAEDPAADERDHDRADADVAHAESAEARSTAPAAALVAQVLDVVAFALAFPFHALLLGRPAGPRQEASGNQARTDASRQLSGRRSRPATGTYGAVKYAPKKAQPAWTGAPSDVDVPVRRHQALEHGRHGQAQAVGQRMRRIGKGGHADDDAAGHAGDRVDQRRRSASSRCPSSAASCRRRRWRTGWRRSCCRRQRRGRRRTAPARRRAWTPPRCSRRGCPWPWRPRCR